MSKIRFVTLTSDINNIKEIYSDDELNRLLEAVKQNCPTRIILRGVDKRIRTMMTKYDKERFNKRIGGEVQISADIRINDFMTESATYVTITESSLYERICQYALQHGEDLQGMFKDERYEYMSCFVRDVAAFKANFESEEMLKPLFNHGNGDTVEFVISVPEKRVKGD
ncbi:hypothetical protein ACMC57_004013 [Escherichia coli]